MNKKIMFDYVKSLFSKDFKDWVRSHPSISNPIDCFFNSTEVAIHTNIPTMLTISETLYLFQLAKEIKGGTFLEIGCYAGGSTRLLGEGAYRSDSLVYSVDIFNSSPERQRQEDDGSFYCAEPEKKPSKAEVERALKRQGLERVVALIEGFSREVAQNWNMGAIDLLWIDGNHKQAFEDFYAWKRHLAQGAAVAFHDSNYPVCGREDVASAVLRIIGAECPEYIKRVDSITSFKMR